MAQGSTVTSSVPDNLEAPADLPIDDATLESDGTDNAEAAIDARARQMGWKPLAEYRGPPGKWQPAADFIARGENILPILRDQFRRVTERVGKLEGEITGLRSTNEEQLKIIKDLRDMGQRANQAGFDRAMAEIKAKQRQAVEAGDSKAYDQLVEQAEALHGSREQINAPPASKTAEPPAPPPRPAVSPAMQSFVSQNSWFNTDQFLTRKMIDRHIDVIQEGEIADEAEQLVEAKRRLVEDYPDRLGESPPPPREPQRRTPRRAAVAQPTAEPNAPAPGTAATTINAIPDPAERAQAREAFNRWKRQLPDITEKEYMELYTDPHSDVLSMQQKPRK